MKTRMLTVMVASVALAAAALGCGGANETVPMGRGDLSAELLGSFTSLSGILGSIKDESSAQAALPRLEAANADLDRITQAASSASPETKAGLSQLAAAQIPQLRKLTDQACAIPGVKPVIQPPMDSMLAKFAGF